MKSQTDGAGFQSYLVCKLHIRLYNIFIFYSISFLLKTESLDNAILAFWLA